MKKKEEEKSRLCAYDWKPGSNWFLVCQVCASRHTVIRMPSLGHDVLKELFHREMLTSAALEEARKEFSEGQDERWLMEI